MLCLILYEILFWKPSTKLSPSGPGRRHLKLSLGAPLDSTWSCRTGTFGGLMDAAADVVVAVTLDIILEQNAAVAVPPEVDYYRKAHAVKAVIMHGGATSAEALFL
ncbi:expressed unknown protein [Seminavis robusta]|uniref:Uncharacterized protein n=1 Tax=Seminavis robusta TaxID=568900 RepID=A0A9N8DAX1_9STRA|nr:expressed unknown protein [Seminavis robusta]|eukprot:Sro39_g024160.1 n/a (106) ;mRNA; r:80684-81001